MLNFGVMITAFRYTDNVGFQDQQNFGAYNLHFHYIAAWYPFPPASHQSVTRQGVGFSSEVAANLSSCWIFTSWRLRALLGAPVSSVVDYQCHILFLLISPKKAQYNLK